MVQPARVRIFAGLLLVAALAMIGCPNSAGVTCPNGQQYCDGKCLFIATDPRNCGACGMSCQAGLGCFDSKCGCPAGLATCNEMCVNTAQDNLNCGSCGNACPAGNVCMGGMCKPGCTGSLLLCGTSCVDGQNDPKNCGMCGKTCDVNNFCVGGQCVFGCPSPLIVCTPDAGATSMLMCIDSAVDPNNCGGCGTRCSDLAAEGSSFACCGKCVDVFHDTANCGTCGHACTTGGQCIGGNCTTP